MSFDTKAYDSDILKPLVKDKAQLADIQRAIREVQSASGVKVLAGLDLSRLLAIPPDRDNLTEHFRSVEMHLNKRRNMSSAQLLSKLVDGMKSVGLQLSDRALWEQFDTAKTDAQRAKVDEFATAVALEHQALKVITRQQLADKAKLQGLGSMQVTRLTSVLEGAGISVCPDFQLPAVPIPRVISELAKHTEYRSLVDVLLLGEPSKPMSITVIDALAYDGRPIDAAHVEAARRAAESGRDSDALQAAQKALGLIRKDYADPDDLKKLVLATFAATAKEMLGRGELLASALANLSNDTALHPVEAARLLAKLAGSTSTRDLNDVTSLLAEGALSDARRTFDAIADAEQFGKDEIQRVSDLLTSAEGRKSKLVAAYEAAIQTRDYASAATALSQAVGIDKHDLRLQSQLDSLPPPPPENLVVKPTMDGGLALSWGTGSASECTFIVVRSIDGHVPRNTADGTQIARDLTASVYVDPNPPVAQQLQYAVFSERRGAASLPAVAGHVLLPAPADLSASASPNEVTVMWRLAKEAIGVQITRIDPDGRTAPVPVVGENRVTVRGLDTGRRYRFKLEAVYVLGDGTRLVSSPAAIDATPRGAVRAVTDLQVGDTSLTDGRQGHVAVWSEPSGFPVELWSFPVDEKLPMAGSEVALADLDAIDGRRVNGVVSSSAEGKTRLAFSKLQSLRTLAAITVDGDRGLWGDSAIVGSAPSVKNVQADRYGDELVVSWEWPHGDYSAKITWASDGMQRAERCSRAEYKADGGFRIRAGDSVDKVSVSTVAHGSGTEWVASPVEIKLAARLPIVRYELEIPPLRFGRRKPVRAVVHPNGYEGSTTVLVVARTSSIMPSRSDDGDVIDRLDISMDGNSAVVVEFGIPKLRSPFWVRLFSANPAVKLEDPPTNQLKG